MAKLVVLRNGPPCDFCGFKKNDYLRYGPIYGLGDIRAHYYCVLLSNQMRQKGKDNEGILGFLLSDIRKELRRTENVKCIYCRGKHASISCAVRRCRATFHLPCGLQNGSLHQFVNEFKSFCKKHRPSQNVPEKIRQEVEKSGAICCICYDSVNLKDRLDVLWAPCCLKTWYHRDCVQKLAHSAGYFFRCAACNDVKKFNDWMQRNGIFVPQQDASWELVPNAFVELLFRYNSCDAEDCKCPGGRNKNSENTRWEIVLCGSCGSQGMHIACGNLKFLEPEWECPACEEVTKNIKPSTEEVQGETASEGKGSSTASNLAEVSQKKRRRSCEDLENSVLDKRKKCRTSDEKEDKEDEGTEDSESSEGSEDREDKKDNEDNEYREDKENKESKEGKKDNEGSEDKENNKGSENREEEGGEEVEIDVVTVEEENQTGETNNERRDERGVDENEDENDDKKDNENDNDSDSDSVIEVQSIESCLNDFQEVMVSLKPGPLSYKLSVLRRMMTCCAPPNRGNENVGATPVVIDLAATSDSDEENYDEIEVMEKSEHEAEGDESKLRYLAKEKSTETWQEKASNGKVVTLGEVGKASRKCSSHSEVTEIVSGGRAESSGDVRKESSKLAALLQKGYPSAVEGYFRNRRKDIHKADSKLIKTDHIKEELRSAVTADHEIITLKD